MGRNSLIDFSGGRSGDYTADPERLHTHRAGNTIRFTPIESADAPTGSA
ncbi:hypothetical protein NRB20_59810 [Nocardia sp. RB20]|uniref:Uncharacterized protein n=1 Tax=Nocardia macrotermitis TaxID=2585198 RepID=A0A7K0DAZ9_9NOCA|nr:hypothetical protein [Nocardia macrotermitis]